MLKRKLQQLPFSEFAQISRAKRLKFSQNSADDTLFTQPGSQECHSGEKRADNNKLLSRAKRLKFSQNSADDTLFTQPGSQNAILERNAQILINF